ncbi:MAG UNVERIFIED_CONTAM: hypothetical protein LVT10_01890 [Anaerolineae bacterium]
MTDEELKQVVAPTVAGMVGGKDELDTNPSQVLTRAWATLPMVATGLGRCGAGHDISLERPQLVEHVILQHRSNLICLK